MSTFDRICAYIFSVRVRNVVAHCVSIYAETNTHANAHLNKHMLGSEHTHTLRMSTREHLKKSSVRMCASSAGWLMNNTHNTDERMLLLPFFPMLLSLLFLLLLLLSLFVFAFAVCASSTLSAAMVRICMGLSPFRSLLFILGYG